MSAGTTVSVPYDTFQALKDEVSRLKAELRDAKRRVEEAELGAEGSNVRRYVDALNDALNVVCYTLGTVTPMSVRGMPFQNIYRLSDALDLPGVNPALRGMGNDWKLQADQYKYWEDGRAKGMEQEMLAEDNAVRGAKLDAFGIGPDDPIG